MSRAFTLIELLVVVTIIVVLLALLTPALDRAIYQTELAVCGARLKSLGTGVTAYAAASKRAYPYRVVVKKNAGQPSRLSSSLGNTAPTGRWINDDRRMLEGYTGYENYLDKFLPRVDIEGSDIDTNIFAQYSIWFGFGYPAHKAMNKIGDRVEWTSEAAGDPMYRFSLLASDPDHLRSENNYAFTSHPDDKGLLAPTSLQDKDPTTPQLGQFGVVKMTIAWWQRSGMTPARGDVDLNYAHEDGSVRRLEAVRWDEWQDYERIVRVPESSNSDTELVSWHQLPRP